MSNVLFLLGVLALALIVGARVAARVYVARTPDLTGITVSTATGCATTGGAGRPSM